MPVSEHTSASSPPPPGAGPRPGASPGTASRPGRTRLTGYAALAGAVLAVLIGPLHALARLRGPGAEDMADPLVSWWAVPATEALGPLLDLAPPDVVYRAYGLVWFPALAASTACAMTVRRLRAGRRGRVEAVGWWLALPGLGLLSLGAFTSYWLGLVDEGFVYLTLPGLLLAMLGQTVLGVGLLLARARPRVLGALLASVLPLVVLTTSFGSQALGAVVVVCIWAVAGAALVRDRAGRVPVSAPAPG